MSNIIAYKVLSPDQWTVEPDDQITLDEEDRFRRRIALTSDNGVEFMLLLQRAERINHGDGLLLDNGHMIKVLAIPEPLYEVRGADGLALLTLGWHLGNRHQPTEIYEDHLRIRQDAVIADMLQGLGATLTPVTAPFSPVSGAYVGKTAPNAHDHSEGAVQSHTHEHDHAH
ncbi:urease accessory protein UreE [Cohaesibacter celericrescens]|uniref:urease accessory protein UreE n=1 Tax=Cohaesibacter celericrescens TaxID=2067669 RepID=UPI001FE0A1C8|nr:urease accessory protein UreE [Cohaesibacter celericrescens]